MSKQKQAKPVKGAVEAAGEILDRVATNVTVAEIDRSKVKPHKPKPVLQTTKGPQNNTNTKKIKTPVVQADQDGGVRYKAQGGDPRLKSAKTKPLPQGALQEALKKAAPAVKAAVKTTLKPGAKVAKRVAAKASHNRGKPTVKTGTTPDGRRMHHIQVPANVGKSQTSEFIGEMLKDVQNPQRRHRRPTRAAMKARAEQLLKDAASWGLGVAISYEQNTATVKVFDLVSTQAKAA